MKKLLSVLVLFVSFAGLAQLGGEDEVYLSGEIIPPKFQGGDVTAFHQYVGEHFDQTKAKPGRMIAAFTIDETGQITNLRITEFVDAASAGEFIRVLKAAPKWVPAQKNGKPYAIKITLPLEFKDHTLSFPRPKKPSKKQ